MHLNVCQVVGLQHALAVVICDLNVSSLSIVLGFEMRICFASTGTNLNWLLHYIKLVSFKNTAYFAAGTWLPYISINCAAFKV